MTALLPKMVGDFVAFFVTIVAALAPAMADGRLGANASHPDDALRCTTKRDAGWGAGYEAALGPRVSVNAEYLHFDLGQPDHGYIQLPTQHELDDR